MSKRVISSCFLPSQVRDEIDGVVTKYTHTGYYHPDLSFGEPVFDYKELKEVRPFLARSLRSEVSKVLSHNLDECH